MSEEYKGVLKVIELTGVASAETLLLKPDEGYTWAIQEAWGYHDDTTALLSWVWTDVSYTKSAAKTGVTRLTNVQHPLLDAGCPGPVYACVRCYPYLSADAIAAGKYLYIRAIVREWRGYGPG